MILHQGRHRHVKVLFPVVKLTFDTLKIYTEQFIVQFMVKIFLLSYKPDLCRLKHAFNCFVYLG